MLCLLVPNNIWGPPAVGHQGFKQENLGIWSAVPPGGEPDFWQAGRATPVRHQTVESKDTSVAVSSLSTSYAVRATTESLKKNKESIFSPRWFVFWPSALPLENTCLLNFSPSFLLIHPLFSTFTEHFLCFGTIKGAGVTEVNTTNKSCPHGFSYS